MPIYKGINKYKIENEVTTVYLYHKGIEYKCLIDTEDLQKLIDLNVHWSLHWSGTAKCFYVRYTKKKLYLSRYLLNIGDNLYADHKNHDTLDNRKSNLIISTNQENTRNRKKRNSNNKTGYRNVCFSNGWYIIQLQVNGKNKVVGKNRNVHDAGKMAKELRKKYYGENSGNN